MLCKGNVHCATCKAWVEAGVSFFLQVLQNTPSGLRGALAGRVRLIWVNALSCSTTHCTREKNFKCLKVWKFLKIFFWKCVFLEGHRCLGDLSLPSGACIIWVIWIRDPCRLLSLLPRSEQTSPDTAATQTVARTKHWLVMGKRPRPGFVPKSPNSELMWSSSVCNQIKWGKHIREITFAELHTGSDFYRLGNHTQLRSQAKLITGEIPCSMLYLHFHEINEDVI